MRKLTTQSWLAVAPKKKAPKNKQQVLSVLESTELDLKAFLGTATVTMKELLDFQIGDVMILDQKKRHLLRIYVGDRQLFTARAGVIGTNKAIRIVDWCKAEG